MRKMKKLAFIWLWAGLFLLCGSTAVSGQAAAPSITRSVAPVDINIAGSGENEETTITIEITGAGDEWTKTVRLDVVFALDSSGSMISNDPNNLRLFAANLFVDMMDFQVDQAGVVSWDSDIDFTLPLTDDINQIKNAINSVNRDGNTNLDAGLLAAVQLLDERKQADSVRAIIFLTDGDGQYTPSTEAASPVAEAAAKGYTIYSIGLDNAGLANLTDMAAATGGTFYASPSPERLITIFNEIFIDIISTSVPHFVDVKEVLPSYLVEIGNFSIPPTRMKRENKGTTVYWEDIGFAADGNEDLSADETVVLSYRAKSSQEGQHLDVAVNGSSVIAYRDSAGGSESTADIPNGKINVSAVQAGNPPDVSGAFPNTDCLWPVNHAFNDVTIEGVTDSSGNPVTIEITGITSDEPSSSAKGAGGGKHAADAEGIGTDTASLRAERAGTGNGRVYEITFLAQDDAGLTSEGRVTVNVPPNQKKKTCDSIDDGQIYDATMIE